MSPRAAWRLESLGFSQVYEYVAGKADWLAFGLPSEGHDANTQRVGQIARRDVPTCALHERVPEVRDRVETAGWDECLVVNDRQVVLGRLHGASLEVPADTTAEEAMEPGPTTTRPDEPLIRIGPRLRDKHVGRIIVTTPDGRLVGIAERRTAERALRERHDTEDDHD
ncbi:MAG: CBS domain-containing protein [Thermomicrobiales bacterium]